MQALIVLLLLFALIITVLTIVSMARRQTRLATALRQADADAARFRLLAGHSADLGWIVDVTSAGVLYMSPAAEAQFGYAPEQASVLLQSLLDELPERVEAVAAGDTARRHHSSERELAHHDGTLIPVELSSTLVADAGGAPLLVGTIRNIAERRAQHAAQKKFASMISHEFRTPLATIDGAIQRLEMTAGDVDDATRKRYSKIQSAVDRLLGMINEYLSPERMASIGRTRHPNDLVPRELLDAAATASSKASPGHPVTVRCSGLPDLIRCDPDGMRLCLQVLLDNATKYTPPGSPIELVGRKADGGGIEFLVIDNGAGVAADERDKVFDKFFRGRNATEAGVAGSGLGLYMARAVLDVHGGTLSVEHGTGVGAKSGAVFRIWLPIAIDSGKTLAHGECNSDNSSKIIEVGNQNT